MFRWEPEGRYRCTKSVEIAPFWFSMDHLWTAIVPFWLSTYNITYRSTTSTIFDTLMFENQLSFFGPNKFLLFEKVSAFAMSLLRKNWLSILAEREVPSEEIYDGMVNLWLIMIDMGLHDKNLLFEHLKPHLWWNTFFPLTRHYKTTHSVVVLIITYQWWIGGAKREHGATSSKWIHAWYIMCVHDCVRVKMDSGYLRSLCHSHHTDRSGPW